MLTLKNSIASGAAVLTFSLTLSNAWALDEIIRPYQSVRSAGMGGVIFTTGQYEENFFANPARVTENPKLRITILDPTVEINSHLPSTIGDLTGGGDTAQKIASTAGNNSHGRIEFTMPSVYVPPAGDFKWGFAAGLITSIDANVDLRQNFDANVQTIGDIGPAVSVGRKLLDDNSLSVGTTLHAIYRVAPSSNYSVANALASKNFFSLSDAGNGSMIDFDLGTTYQIPWENGPVQLEAGAAVDNVLGGRYADLSFHPIKSGTLPMAQPRALSFGVAARRPEIGPFTNFVAALEFTDIGNNTNGGLFRTVHLGGETRFGILLPRIGVNQGYLCAGVGLDLRFFTVDLATYGEEMGLNPGDLEDRRYAVRLAFQI